MYGVLELCASTACTESTIQNSGRCLLSLQLHADGYSQEWNGDYFKHVTLKSLGLHVQLGHPPGSVCYNRKPAAGNDFVVIDVNGIHEVNLDFCGCVRAQTHYKQPLRSR